jgi:hypothetical protein
MLAATFSLSVPASSLPSQLRESVPFASMVDTKFSYPENMTITMRLPTSTMSTMASTVSTRSASSISIKCWKTCQAS